MINATQHHVMCLAAIEISFLWHLFKSSKIKLLRFLQLEDFFIGILDSSVLSDICVVNKISLSVTWFLFLFLFFFYFPKGIF